MRSIALPLLLLAALAMPLLAAAPELGGPETLKAGKEVIDVDVGHAVPCVFDWDRDGKKDLLVGQFGGGKIRLYRNVGKDDAPAFDSFEYLKAGGAEISLPAG